MENREKELVESIKALINEGCEFASEIDGDTNCYYCGAYLGADVPHDKDCAYVKAKNLIERLSHD